MANKIQIKRGVLINLPTLDSGEFAFTTDTKQVFIGDGSVNYELAKKTYVDNLVVSGLNWMDAVLDKDLTSPPVSPTVGDRYWIAATASGVWSGQEYNVAEWQGAEWSYTEVSEGDAAYVDDENVFYYYNGVDLSYFAAGMGTHATSHIDGTDDIQLATSAQKGLMSSTYASKIDGIDEGAEVNPDVVPQAEAEAGVATTERIWTAERVKQAIDALATTGSSTLLNLTDTPSTYSGNSLKVLRVDTTASGVEFVDFGASYLEDSPTDNELSKAPTSNWAYDHTNASTDVHGAGTETLLHSGSTIDGGTFI